MLLEVIDHGSITVAGMDDARHIVRSLHTTTRCAVCNRDVSTDQVTVVAWDALVHTAILVCSQCVDSHAVGCADCGVLVRSLCAYPRGPLSQCDRCAVRIHRCNHCGIRIDQMAVIWRVPYSISSVRHYERQYCSDCLTTLSSSIPIGTCDQCGRHWQSDCLTAGGTCPDCALGAGDADYAILAEGRYHLRSTVTPCTVCQEYTSDGTLCGCHAHFTECIECGDLSDCGYRELCPTCEDAWYISSVQVGYHGKGDYERIGQGPDYVGVELELSGDIHSIPKSILADFEVAAGFAVHPTSDATVEGTEFVTDPISIETWIKSYKSGNLQRGLSELGYHYDVVPNCGLHVNLSSIVLGASDAEQRETASKILYLHCRHYREFAELSGRCGGAEECAEWAYADEDGSAAECERIIDRCDKYSAVRRHSNRYEYRMPAATTSAYELMDQIIGFYHLCIYCRLSSWEDIATTTFDDYFSERDTYVASFLRQPIR